MDAAADDELVELLGGARRILVFTGAGVSTGSGIRDYRGPSGVWRSRQPVLYQDFLASEQARIEYWEQKLEAYDEFARAEPGPTHQACVRLHALGRLELLVTQNIDGLHERAGIPRDALVELHGTNARVSCQSCGTEADAAAAYAAFRRQRRCPRCTGCGGPLKQATISFGQSLEPENLNRAAAAAAACDLVVALGSTLSVYPAAEFPLLAARRGVPYAVINRGPTEHDGSELVRLRLEGDVDAIFPPAVAAAFAD
jgi:NAD-dependent deacetylase